MLRCIRSASIAVPVVLTMSTITFSQEPSAASLYRSSGSFGLRISVELKRDRATRIVSPQVEFHEGDRVRLHFVSNSDGYVYALNETPAGDTKLIFPTTEAGTSNLVQKQQDYTIPATKGWFRLTGPSGAERVLIILSPRALPGLENKSQGVTQTAQAGVPASQPHTNSAPKANPDTLSTTSGGTVSATNATSGTIDLSSSQSQNTPLASGGTSNSTNASSNKNQTGSSSLGSTRQDVNKVRSGISLGRDLLSIPKDVISIVPGLGSRDLVFEDDMQQDVAYVSSKAEGLNDPVIFSITLVYH